jgi:Mg2+ and Co2+ transporter CorA
MKTIKLSESDLNRIVKKIIEEQESNEGILDPLKNIASGLKGTWRGEGYDYFKYLSSLHNQINSLQKLDKPNHQIMTKLVDLKNKIGLSKMDTQKKKNITDAIDFAINHFTQYTNTINHIEKLISQKIS